MVRSMLKSRDILLDSRIREIKRKILHCKDKITRDIYKSHIEYLEVEKMQYLESYGNRG